MALSIAVEPIESGAAQLLLTALDGYLGELYPPESNFLELDADELTEGRGAFLIARQHGDVVGCGAVRRISSSTAEVKRVFVVPSARGQGVASQILVRLELWAADAGASRLVLEVGHGQFEAIRLYEKVGFRLIPCFGQYQGSEMSVCYEKVVDVASR